jgi:hypothetical protein
MIRYSLIVFKKIFYFILKFKGVGVYDLRARRLVGFEETDGSTEYVFYYVNKEKNQILFRLPRGVYPSRISWNDPTTLVIACAKTIKIMSITSEANYEHQSASPKKYMNTG